MKEKKPEPRLDSGRPVELSDTLKMAQQSKKQMPPPAKKKKPEERVIDD